MLGTGAGGNVVVVLFKLMLCEFLPVIAPEGNISPWRGRGGLSFPRILAMKSSYLAQWG